MNIPPKALVGIGIGAGVAVATATAFGVSAGIDSIMRKHPTGSAGDTPSMLLTVGAALGGIGIAAGGMIAAAHGGGLNALKGAAIIAGGGAFVGAIAGGIAGSVRHGSGVDTIVDSTIRSFDQFPQDGQLDLNGSFWNYPESMSISTSTDSDTHETTTTVYDLSRFTNRADVNGDRMVTRPEAHTLVKSFDTNGDDRLQGTEKRDFDRQVGVRSYSTTFGGDYWSGGNYGSSYPTDWTPDTGPRPGGGDNY